MGFKTSALVLLAVLFVQDFNVQPAQAFFANDPMQFEAMTQYGGLLDFSDKTYELIEPNSNSVIGNLLGVVRKLAYLPVRLLLLVATPITFVFKLFGVFFRIITLPIRLIFKAITLPFRILRFLF